MDMLRNILLVKQQDAKLVNENDSIYFNFYVLYGKWQDKMF
jgi:hypothetical protein